MEKRLSNDPSNTSKRYANRQEVRRRYPVSDMTLHRWMSNPAVGFPKPIKFGNHRNARGLWDLDELDAYDARRAAERA
jgi:predicted DNA-binding transcriptional regulator AlpA